MLKIIRRASTAPSTTIYVCILCQRYPTPSITSLSIIRTVSTAIKPIPKAQAPPELVKEIRAELEAHRQGLQKKKIPGNAPQDKWRKAAPAIGPSASAGGGTVDAGKKKDIPRAPPVRRRANTRPVGMPIAHIGQTISDALKVTPRHVMTLNPSTVKLEPIVVENQPPVPSLSHDLDRVLFNPGVYFLQDPRSRVYNFNPYLQKLMPVNEFQFEALSEYITSSRDGKLEHLAKKLKKKYVGSTSSMTSVLSHFHYLLSSWRPINPNVMSKSLPTPWKSFTALQRGPQAIFLRWKSGVYAIDADKEFDKESVLTYLGKSMEKLLTLPPASFERYRRTDQPVDLSPQKRAIDTYHYSTLGDFLMRSQLDAHDPRLPGTGMFDLKTRAVVSIRMDVDNFHLGSGYQIKNRFGEWESFEREYFDMIRAAFLKYSLQVRMGRMDGIFVAFHNTERIFGFQYITLEEMDASMHQDWNSGIGDREFKLSLQLLNEVLNKATEKFPRRSLRIHFETRETQTPLMHIFIEPMEEEDVHKIQNAQKRDMRKFLKDIGDRKEAYLRNLAENKPNLNSKLKADEKFTEVQEKQKPDKKNEAVGTKETGADKKAEVEKKQGGAGKKVDVAGKKVDVVEKQGEVAKKPEAAENKAGVAEKQEGMEKKPDVVEKQQGEVDKSETDEKEEVEGSEKNEMKQKPLALEDEVLDEAWAEQMAKELEDAEKPGKEMLAYALKIKSYVNGKVVIRPDRLRPSDSWEIRYELEEFAGSRAWTTYRACHARRVELRREAEDVPGTAGGRKGSDIRDMYIQRLRDLSAKGREYLTLKEKESETEKIVWKGSST